MRMARVAFEGGIHAARFEDGFFILDDSAGSRELLPGEVTLLPPAVPSKVLAVGWNFSEHIKEMSGQLPADRVTQAREEPNIFLKPSSCLIAAGEPIVYPADATRVDYEAELAVVVGHRLRRASPQECRAAVAGWTCANDVTERDMQRRDKQWWRAKGFDSFGPLGPWLETETPEPDALIRSWVNGELRQVGRVRDMLRGPDEILSYISQAMTLLPGDVVMLGTPPGVGELRPGDQVRVEVEGIGSLENPVVAETIS